MWQMFIECPLGIKHTFGHQEKDIKQNRQKSRLSDSKQIILKKYENK